MKTLVDGDTPAPYERFSWFHSFFGPPLLPSAQDIAYCWEMASEWIRERGAPRALLLGITPAFCTPPWPKGTDLLAVDFSQTMIDTMWPGPKEAALCANWLSMDLPKGSRDIALCDGGLPLLDYPQGQHDVVRILHRVLSDEGLCIFRTFVLPSQRETPDLVIRDFCHGKIGDLSSLVFRLNMSMQKDPEQGIVFGRVYEAIAAIPDLDKLLAELGWSPEHLTLINRCKGIESQCHFLTLEQTIDLFCSDPGGFRVLGVHTPSDDLGQRCPTVTLQRC
jgi:hypothetical protein